MAAKTLTILGTMSAYVAEGGPTVPVQIGSPDVAPTDEAGATLSFTESFVKNMTITVADGVVALSFDNVADADLLYIGVDNDMSVKIDGSATAVTLAAGGFVMIFMGSAASATLQATTGDTVVTVAGYGA